MSKTVGTGHTEDLAGPVPAQHAGLPIATGSSAEVRYEALARADETDLVALADRILEAPTPVEVVAGPSVVSAPLRLGVPGGEGTVVVGHVALTRCEVALDGVRGDGVRQGRSLEAAIAAAICDAEAERGGPFAAAVHELVSASLENAREAERARGLSTNQTRIGDES